MWDTRSIPGFGAGSVQRWWEALRGYLRATFDHARSAFDSVRTTAHSADTHERLHHLLTGRRGRLQRRLPRRLEQLEPPLAGPAGGSTVQPARAGSTQARFFFTHGRPIQELRFSQVHILPQASLPGGASGRPITA